MHVGGQDVGGLIHDGAIIAVASPQPLRGYDVAAMHARTR